MFSFFGRLCSSATHVHIISMIFPWLLRWQHEFDVGRGLPTSSGVFGAVGPGRQCEKCLWTDFFVSGSISKSQIPGNFGVDHVASIIKLANSHDPCCFLPQVAEEVPTLRAYLILLERNDIKGLITLDLCSL